MWIIITSLIILVLIIIVCCIRRSYIRNKNREPEIDYQMDNLNPYIDNDSVNIDTSSSYKSPF